MLAACRPTAEPRAPAEPKDVAIAIEGEGTRLCGAVMTSAGPVIIGNGAAPLRIGARTIPPTSDAFVAAFDHEGAVRWIHRMRSDAHVIVDGPTAMPDDSVVFVGAFQRALGLGDRELSAGDPRHCFLARVAADGDVVALHGLGGSEQTVCRSIVIDDDAAWLLGAFSGTLQLGDREHVSKGMLDMFVAHVQLSSGIVDRAFSFGTAAEDFARDLLLVGDDLLIVGTYGGELGVAATDRALALSPSVKLESAGDADGFVARFDRAGVARWALRQAGPGFDVVKQLAPLGDGFAATVLSQKGAPPPDVSGLAADVPLGGWIVHFDADGEERWRWTDPALASPSAIVSTDRGVAFSGHYRDGLVAGDDRWPARGTSDAMWIELDASGRFLRGDHCGSAGADHSDAIAIDREQRIWWGGGSEADSTCTGETAGGFLRRGLSPTRTTTSVRR